MHTECSGSEVQCKDVAMMHPWTSDSEAGAAALSGASSCLVVNDGGPVAQGLRPGVGPPVVHVLRQPQHLSRRKHVCNPLQCSLKGATLSAAAAAQRPGCVTSFGPWWHSPAATAASLSSLAAQTSPHLTPTSDQHRSRRWQRLIYLKHGTLHPCDARETNFC